MERHYNIILRGYMTNKSVQVSAYRTVKVFCNREQLPNPMKAHKLDHLRSIADQMPPLLDIPVGLLIGMDHAEIIQPFDSKPAPKSKSGKAFGVETLFGWTMCGGEVDKGDRKRNITTYKADIRKETIKPDQWKYVKTNDNPSDIASRGATAKELSSSSSWLHGPSFLHKTDISEYVADNNVEREISDTDPEVRKPKLTCLLMTTITSSLIRRFTKYSNWKTLTRSIAILKICARQKSFKLGKSCEIQPSNLQEASNFIIKTVQTENFPQGIDDKSLAKLNPLLDNDGIMRVGGRATGSFMIPYSLKHPILLPKKSHVSHLVTKHYHKKVFHAGSNQRGWFLDSQRN